MEPGYKYAFGSMAKAEQQLNYKFDDANSIIFGAFFENYFSSPKGVDLEQPVDVNKNIGGILQGSIYPGNPNGIKAEIFMVRYLNYGAYVQSQHNPIENLYLTLGLRFDYNTRYKEAINPRVGLVYKFSDKTTFKLLYGSAFLSVPPRIEYEIYGSFYSDDNGATYKSWFFHLPNNNIKPVKSQTIEAGFKTYLTNELGFTFNTFYALYKGLYADDVDNTIYGGKYMGWPVATIMVYKNKKDQTNYGAEAEVNYLFKISSTSNIFSYLTVSYVDGFMDSKAPNGKNYQIGNIAPIMVKGGLDVTYSDFTISPRFIYNSKSRLSSPANNTTEKMKEIDGYFLLNVFASYKVTENIKLKLNIQNALDSRYYSIGPLNPSKGTPQKPIHVMAGLGISL